MNDGDDTNTVIRWVLGAGAVVVSGVGALIWKAGKRDQEFETLKQEVERLRQWKHDVVEPKLRQIGRPAGGRKDD